MAKHAVTDQGEQRCSRPESLIGIWPAAKSIPAYIARFIILCDISLIVRYVTIVLRTEIETKPTAMCRSVR
jgi:hypothetical protein